MVDAKPQHDGQVILVAGEHGVESGEHLAPSNVNAIVDEFYSTIGGEPFFTALGVEFYRLVSEDPMLAPLFPGERWAVHARRLTAHFLQLYGENDLTAAWDPRMHRAHCRRVITREQRLRWLQLMRTAAENLRAPEDQLEQFMQIMKIASGEMMAVSRGAAIARGETFYWDGSAAK